LAELHPAPWRVDEDKDGLSVLDAEGVWVLSIKSAASWRTEAQVRAVLDRIVKAVNAQDAAFAWEAEKWSEGERKP